jgi:VIT1/CCC1 family predicted Fe2+/Mn2+ transporter
MSSVPFRATADAHVANAGDDAAALRSRVETVSRGGARAAVLGVNDGLVTNVCLILAVAGASSGAGEVRIAGLASLIAGALSMAAGEWISVRSQVELYEGIIADLRRLVIRNPRLVLDELADKLEEAGLADDTAHRVAAELPLDEQRFFDFSSRTVFGFDPDQLGSPRVAAASSLCLFALGAIVPLAPWFLVTGTPAIVASVIGTALATTIVGGWVSRSSGRPIVNGVSRQLAIVIAASAVTYGVGSLFGTAVG